MMKLKMVDRFVACFGMYLADISNMLFFGIGFFNNPVTANDVLRGPENC